MNINQDEKEYYQDFIFVAECGFRNGNWNAYSVTSEKEFCANTLEESRNECEYRYEQHTLASFAEAFDGLDEIPKDTLKKIAGEKPISELVEIADKIHFVEFYSADTPDRVEYSSIQEAPREFEVAVEYSGRDKQAYNTYTLAEALVKVAENSFEGIALKNHLLEIGVLEADED